MVFGDKRKGEKELLMTEKTCQVERWVERERSSVQL
jgi:hypothetical protein